MGTLCEGWVGEQLFTSQELISLLPDEQYSVFKYPGEILYFPV